MHLCEIQRGGRAAVVSAEAPGVHPAADRTVKQENLQVCGGGSETLWL